MSLIIPNAQLLEKCLFFDGSPEADGTVLAVKIPAAFRQAVLLLMGRSWARHGGYIKLGLDTPFKPRTAGPKKMNPDDPGFQSNHLHGHLSQLAIHFGYTKQEMKEIMKDDVPEWPMEERKIGKRVKLRPASEADVSTAVESKAIEWTHMIAGEEGVVLNEGKSRMRGM